MSTQWPLIPTPARVRWREFRYQFIPFLVFAAVLGATIVLWGSAGQQTEFFGEVQTNLLSVTTTQAGLLQGLSVGRHDPVHRDDELGRIVVYDPELTRASLDAIEAELGSLETRLDWTEMGREETIAKMGLELMSQRNLLSVAQTNLLQAEIVLRRDEDLLKPPNPAIAQAVYEVDRTRRDVLRTEVDDRAKLIEQWTRELAGFSPTGTNIFSQIHPTIQRDIAARQKQLSELEKPLVLKAPSDGVVNAIFHRNGERVMAGTTILTMVPKNSPQIIAYQRAPLSTRAKPGDTVTVWTKTLPRRKATAKILRVGSQLEPIPAVVLPPSRMPPVMGLPVTISLPVELDLLPGEGVDLFRVEGK